MKKIIFLLMISLMSCTGLVATSQKPKETTESQDSKVEQLTLSAWIEKCKALPENFDLIFSSKLDQNTPLVKSSYEYLTMIDVFVKQYQSELKSELKSEADSFIETCFMNTSEIGDKDEWVAKNPCYIQKLTIPVKSTVGFMGDIHGSIHSLLRNLDRLKQDGYLDDNFTIKDKGGRNTYLIFLGDYVDRGSYGIEVFYILMILKRQNPDRVFLLRGNHELDSVNKIYGFQHECSVKYGNENVLYNKFNIAFKFLPYALYLGVKGSNGHTSYIQCSHGGIDKNFDVKSFLCNTNGPQFVLCKNGEGFIWSDFDEDTICDTLRENYPRNGMGWIANQQCAKNYLNDLNTSIKDANISVNAFIRGHQHNFFGLKLGGMLYWKTKAGQETVLNLVKYGPIYTFSTATESGVDEPYDCYALLMPGETYKDWTLTPYEYKVENKDTVKDDKTNDTWYCTCCNFPNSPKDSNCSVCSTSKPTTKSKEKRNPTSQSFFGSNQDLEQIVQRFKSSRLGDPITSVSTNPSTNASETFKTMSVDVADTSEWACSSKPIKEDLKRKMEFDHEESKVAKKKAYPSSLTSTMSPVSTSSLGSNSNTQTSNSWECPTCKQSLSLISPFCVMCHTMRSMPVNNQWASVSSATQTNTWSCASCSFINRADRRNCEICGALDSTLSTSLSSSASTPILSPTVSSSSSTSIPVLNPNSSSVTSSSSANKFVVCPTGKIVMCPNSDCKRKNGIDYVTSQGHCYNCNAELILSTSIPASNPSTSSSSNDHNDEDAKKMEQERQKQIINALAQKVEQLKIEAKIAEEKRQQEQAEQLKVERQKKEIDDLLISLQEAKETITSYKDKIFAGNISVEVAKDYYKKIKEESSYKINLPLAQAKYSYPNFDFKQCDAIQREINALVRASANRIRELENAADEQLLREQEQERVLQGEGIDKTTKQIKAQVENYMQQLNSISNDNLKGACLLRDSICTLAGNLQSAINRARLTYSNADYSAYEDLATGFKKAADEKLAHIKAAIKQAEEKGELEPDWWKNDQNLDVGADLKTPAILRSKIIYSLECLGISWRNDMSKSKSQNVIDLLDGKNSKQMIKSAWLSKHPDKNQSTQNSQEIMAKLNGIKKYLDDCIQRKTDIINVLTSLKD